ncbi:NrsF family protein [Novosphingobium aquimarinum]|uniref:NrsF family protein n=1 Tax=Novosphingobium aquimarinum TaxID=2682494 RepID=UPI0012EB67F6|nr:DUF1109 domain-containing protein [Novosphingobium aquimarinum]
MRSNEHLISELAGELRPVAPMTMSRGLAVVIAAAGLSIAAVAGIAGVWDGPAAGTATIFYYLANGLLAMSGFACATDVVRMANPGVGNRYDGAYWSLAMLAIFPVVAVGTLFARGLGVQAMNDSHGLECTLSATAFASITASGLVFWLRRGAPANPARAGLFAGLAAGALGSAAYGLSCPIDTLGHLAIWHVLPVLLAGVIGRIVIPRLLVW